MSLKTDTKNIITEHLRLSIRGYFDGKVKTPIEDHMRRIDPLKEDRLDSLQGSLAKTKHNRTDLGPNDINQSIKAMCDSIYQSFGIELKCRVNLMRDYDDEECCLVQSDNIKTTKYAEYDFKCDSCENIQELKIIERESVIADCCRIHKEFTFFLNDKGEGEVFARTLKFWEVSDDIRR